MDIRENFYYTKEHEWVSIEDDNVGIVGITDYAQEQLGDITYIELPTVGNEVDQFEQFGSIESVKAATDIFCPLSGKIVDVNKELDSEPSLINKNCFETGWIAKIEIANPEEKSNLLTADEYRNFLASLES
jgi:glycine cleavage system H protein